MESKRTTLHQDQGSLCFFTYYYSLKSSVSPLIADVQELERPSNTETGMLVSKIPWNIHNIT